MYPEENLKHSYPSIRQYEKWAKINARTEEEHEKLCVCVNDCSICPMAITQYLITTETHHCVRDMTKEQFELAMDCDCCF